MLAPDSVRVVSLIIRLREERLLLVLATAFPLLLRLAREPGIWAEFHRWSVPMLVVAAGAGWVLIG